MTITFDSFYHHYHHHHQVDVTMAFVPNCDNDHHLRTGYWSVWSSRFSLWCNPLVTRDQISALRHLGLVVISSSSSSSLSSSRPEWLWNCETEVQGVEGVVGRWCGGLGRRRQGRTCSQLASSSTCCSNWDTRWHQITINHFPKSTNPSKIPQLLEPFIKKINERCGHQIKSGLDSFRCWWLHGKRMLRHVFFSGRRNSMLWSGHWRWMVVYVHWTLFSPLYWKILY